MTAGGEVEYIYTHIYFIATNKIQTFILLQLLNVTSFDLLYLYIQRYCEPGE